MFCHVMLCSCSVLSCSVVRCCVLSVLGGYVGRGREAGDPGLSGTLGTTGGLAAAVCRVGVAGRYVLELFFCFERSPPTVSAFVPDGARAPNWWNAARGALWSRPVRRSGLGHDMSCQVMYKYALFGDAVDGSAQYYRMIRYVSMLCYVLFCRGTLSTSALLPFLY